MGRAELGDRWQHRTLGTRTVVSIFRGKQPDDDDLTLLDSDTGHVLHYDWRTLRALWMPVEPDEGIAPLVAAYRERDRDRDDPHSRRMADVLEFVNERYGTGYEFTLGELVRDLGGTNDELTGVLRSLASDGVLYDDGEGLWGLEYE